MIKLLSLFSGIGAFEKALENGSESAASNIKAIESELSYEDEQKRLIEEYLKQYE